MMAGKHGHSAILLDDPLAHRFPLAKPINVLINSASAGGINPSLYAQMTNGLNPNRKVSFPSDRSSNSLACTHYKLMSVRCANQSLSAIAEVVVDVRWSKGIVIADVHLAVAHHR